MPMKKRITKTGTRHRETAAKQVKMVSFGTAVSNFFTKYFRFDGVATRAEYWWAVLFCVLVIVGAAMGAYFVKFLSLPFAFLLLLFLSIFCVVVTVPMWAVMSRRLHDAGFSAKLLWISFIFFIYSMLVPKIIHNIFVVDLLSFMWGLIIFIILLLPSKKQDNPYRG